MNPDIPGAPVEVLVFIAFAIVAVVGALRVVTARDPFGSALSLLINFVALGALYLMLEQPFVAISQILVYAGAVVVLFLFVIAYLGDRRELLHRDDRAPYGIPVGILTVLVLGGTLVAVVASATYPELQELTKTAAGHQFGSPQAIGETFLTDFILEFEVTSLVLLVAAIGGIVLGLTGRARHERLRKLMHTRSADQQKRVHADQLDDVRETRKERSE